MTSLHPPGLQYNVRDVKLRATDNYYQVVKQLHQLFCRYQNTVQSIVFI